MSKTPELKPCPSGHVGASVLNEGEHYEVCCDTCQWYTWAVTKRAAIKRWNTRALKRGGK